jgi:hypothetical protein
MSWMGWAAIAMIAGFALLVVALYLMTEFKDDMERRRRK